jgi:zinc and cadmium transporter
MKPDLLTTVWIIGAVLLDGLAGLAGGLLPTAFVQRNIVGLLAFASGTLVGSVFLDLLPEALSAPDIPANHILTAALIGFLVFYSIEAFFGSHATGHGSHKHDHHHAPVGPLLLLGDALHNMADGVAIAAAFMANTPTGILTTIAVVLHELPQEIGDYSILVAHGYSKRRALFWLSLVQLSALLGAFGAIWVSGHFVSASYYFLAISAGGFMYVAAADLLPEIQRQNAKSDSPNSVARFAAFCAGIALLAILERAHQWVHLGHGH